MPWMGCGLAHSLAEAERQIEPQRARRTQRGRGGSRKRGWAITMPQAVKRRLVRAVWQGQLTHAEARRTRSGTREAKAKGTEPRRRAGRATVRSDLGRGAIRGLEGTEKER